MAKFVAQSEGEALTASTTKTCVQYVAPSTTTARVRAWGISFDGVTAANVPGSIELLRQTTAGTASALTLVDWGPNALTAQGSAQKTFTVEPTAGNILHSLKLTPNGGTYETYYGDDGPEVPTSGRIGVRANFASNVNCTVWMLVEER